MLILCVIFQIGFLMLMGLVGSMLFGGKQLTIMKSVLKHKLQSDILALNISPSKITLKSMVRVWSTFC